MHKKLVADAGLRWWPCATTPIERRSSEEACYIRFLEAATAAGFRGFIRGSFEVGAVAADGRECSIIRRTSERWDVSQLGGSDDKPTATFETFDDASAAALDWLRRPVSDPKSVLE